MPFPCRSSARIGVACLVVLLAAGLNENVRGEPPALTAGQKERLKERDKFHELTHKLRSEGRFAEAIQAAQKMLAIEREVFGRVHLEVAGSFEQLAKLYLAQDDFPSARRATLDLLAIHTELYGEANWRTIDARRLLGDIGKHARLDKQSRTQLREADKLMRRVSTLLKHTRYREALEPCQRALELRKQILGEMHPDYAYSLFGIVTIYTHLNDQARAGPASRRLVEIRRKVLGQEHPDYADSLHFLAIQYRRGGQAEQAIRFYWSAIGIYRQATGRYESGYVDDLIYAYQYLADAAVKREDFRTAYRARQQVVDWMVRLHGPEHWGTADARLALEYVSKLARLNKTKRQHLEQAEELMRKSAALRRQKKYKEAIHPCLSAMEIRRHILGEMDVGYADGVDRLGSLNNDLGKYSQLLSGQRRALEIRRQLTGPKHPAFAYSLNLLAIALAQRDMVDQAIDVYWTAIELHKQTKGEEFETAINNLAYNYRNIADKALKKGDFRTAHRARQQAVDLMVRLHGRDHWQVTDSQLALAAVDARAKLTHPERRLLDQADESWRQALTLFQQKKYKEALRPCLRAAEIRRQVLGEMHEDYAAAIHGCNFLSIRLNDYTPTRLLEPRVIAVRRQVLGLDHPNYASALNDLAVSYEKQGRLEEAVRLYRQAVRIKYGAYGRDDSVNVYNLSGVLKRRANAALDRDDFASARKDRQEVLDLMVRLRGGEHWEVIDARLELARVEQLARFDAKQRRQLRDGEEFRKKAAAAYRKKDYEKAVEFAKQSLYVLKPLVPEKDRNVAWTLSWLGISYDALGDYAAAEPILRQGMEICRQAFGRGHPDYATDLANLARLYKSMGQYGRAETLFREALAIRRQVYGTAHADYVSSLHDLAGNYISMNEFLRAEPLAQEALAIEKQRVGEAGLDYAGALV